MNIETYKLGHLITDSATLLKGMLTHMQIDSGRSRVYSFQPKGVDPETGASSKRTWITEDRIKNGIKVAVDLPMEVLGTTAYDKASGFKGMITAITLHPSGCVHAVIQPKGTQKNGSVIAAEDFDIRMLSGSKIPKLDEEQFKKETKKKPSPTSLPSVTPTIVM